MYSTIALLKTSGVSQGFSELQAAEDAAAAGDCIVVYPGTYNLGTGRLILKNGVNKKFMPGVTITSSHGTATVGDNNVACVQAWDGEPTILNSGAGATLLLQHASSYIEGTSGGIIVLAGSVDPAQTMGTTVTRYMSVGCTLGGDFTTTALRVKFPPGKWRLSGLVVSNRYVNGSGTGTIIWTVQKNGVDTTLIATSTYNVANQLSAQFTSGSADTVDFNGGAMGDYFNLKLVHSTTINTIAYDFNFTILAKKIL